VLPPGCKCLVCGMLEGKRHILSLKRQNLCCALFTCLEPDAMSISGGRMLGEEWTEVAIFKRELTGWGSSPTKS